MWANNPKSTREVCSKLERVWNGPYKVVNKINHVYTEFENLEGGPNQRVYLNRLAPYRGDMDVEDQHPYRGDGVVNKKYCDTNRLVE